MKRLCIIIVNYKSADLTIACVKSLAGQIDPEKDAILIVDNNSGENEKEKIRTGLNFDGMNTVVQLIEANSNDGFSAGNNVGMMYLRAQYYILTNADTVFKPEAVNKLLYAAEKYPDAGLIGPRLENMDGSPQFSSFREITPMSEFVRAAGVGVLAKLFKKSYVPFLPDEKIVYPSWISFACVLVKKDVIRDVGLMDADFFMYYEDVDYCRRVKKIGYKIMYYPFSHVIHRVSQSSGINKENRRLPYYFYHSRARYFIKYYGYAGFIIANIFYYIGIVPSILKKLITGRKRKSPPFEFIDVWIH